MAKVLNLDSLAKEERILTFDGVSYSVKDTTVADFIEINRKAEELDAKGGVSLSDRIAFMVESIAPNVPDCPKEVLLKRSMEELNAIINFIRDGSLPSDKQKIEPTVESATVEDDGKKSE